MLRITIAETATEQRWTLEGRLVQPWVGEMRTCWKNRHRAQNGRSCMIDLSGVTFIDSGGLRLLRTMSREGARFTGKGIYTKHVVEQLKTNTRRGPFDWMLGLFAGFLASVIACSPFTHVNPGPDKMNARQEFIAPLNPKNGSNTEASDFTDGPGGTLCPHS